MIKSIYLLIRRLSPVFVGDRSRTSIDSTEYVLILNDVQNDFVLLYDNINNGIMGIWNQYWTNGKAWSAMLFYNETCTVFRIPYLKWITGALYSLFCAWPCHCHFCASLSFPKTQNLLGTTRGPIIMKKRSKVIKGRFVITRVLKLFYQIYPQSKTALKHPACSFTAKCYNSNTKHLCAS